MRILDDYTNSWRNKFPPASYCSVVNILNSIRRKKHRISPVMEEHILLADDGKSAVFFCRRRRGNQFKRGVMMHVDQLAREYHLDQIDIVPDGVFIDCGANIGELGLWARGQGLAYIYGSEAHELQKEGTISFIGCRSLLSHKEGGK